MSTVASFTIAGVLVMTAALVAISMVRRPSTLDFYLAGQRIGVLTNACAICGDYFSAASFLGVAAAVYASGLDGLWYAAGFAAGFVPVLLFVAAPLRRFGEFSLPDFLGRRFGSETVRVCAVVVVALIVLSYLVPQAVGTGITWELLVGASIFGLSPYATGVIVSTAAIAAVVVLGGMRGTTWSQAIQFLFMVVALGWLVLLAVNAGFDYGGTVDDLSRKPLLNPSVTPEGWSLTGQANRLRPDQPARFSDPGARYGPLGQYGLVISLIFGTAGLPHVMNRYFTAPSGAAARATTVWVLVFAGLFYFMALLLGTAARGLIPGAIASHPWLEDLTVEGVLVVPEHALLVLGRIFGGVPGLSLVTTGALVAAMSTIAGLLLAGAASWGHDFYERYINPSCTQRQAVRAGRVAVLVGACCSALVALALYPSIASGRFPSLVAAMVTWAFGLAGSAITPVLILAIWWRRITAAGAVAGMATGTIVALSLLATGLVWGDGGAGAFSLAYTPTPVAGALALLVAVAVSLRASPPTDLDGIWMRLHGTAADRHSLRLARLTLSGWGTGRRGDAQ